MEHIGSVTSREEKFIQKGDNKGQPFLKVTLEPDKWTYSLFDGQHIKTAKESSSLKVTWEEDGVYRKVVDVEAVEGQQAVELANGAEVRERRITRVAIAKSVIESGRMGEPNEWAYANTWFNWVWETHETPKVERSPEDEAQIKAENIMAINSAWANWTDEAKTDAIKLCAEENNWIKYAEKLKAEGLLGLTLTQVKHLLKHLQEQSRA